ncbi:MAG TPA: carboxypeptidase-like regulatory domain-containing protein [Pyrinomonadaceae bacterium]|nr:carboxypeptidase-like regulatory domain-containing protein [Pyrinomonadaceae bacterium]
MSRYYWRTSLALLAAFTVCTALCASVSAAPAATGGGRRASASLGTVSGSVRDSSGNPLAGALVTLVREGAEEVVRQTRSRADGTFATRVAPGRYVLRAVASGFSPATFSSVQISASSKYIYRFNLEPAGQGNTAPERRADRNDPKFKLRAMNRRRSIFNVKESERTTVEVAGAPASTDATTDASGVEETLEGDDSPSRRARARGVVQTFYASSASPALGDFGGVNFAVSSPFSESLDLIFAGQMGASERLEGTARVRLSARHRLSATLGGARLRLNNTEASDANGGEDSLGQVSVRAVDEWVVRDGVVVVMGLDYSRFVGAAGGDASFTPRLGFQFDADARTRLRAAYAPGTNPAARLEGFEIAEGQPVFFREDAGAPVAIVDGRAVLERTSRLEFGVERVLGENSSVEATAFFDTVDGRGVGLLTAPIAAFDTAQGAELLSVANQQGGARGIRVVYTRRFSEHLEASAGYACGHGQHLSHDGLVNPEQLFQDAFFQTAAAQVDATPLEGTRVRTVLRFSPRAAVFAIDPFAGRLAVYDPSLSILVTQELPNFGLPLRAEAVIDARNVFDLTSGVEDGDSALLVNAMRRMVRGGISVRF